MWAAHQWAPETLLIRNSFWVRTHDTRPRTQDPGPTTEDPGPRTEDPGQLETVTGVGIKGSSCSGLASSLSGLSFLSYKVGDRAGLSNLPSPGTYDPVGACSLFIHNRVSAHWGVCTRPVPAKSHSDWERSMPSACVRGEETGTGRLRNWGNKC